MRLVLASRNPNKLVELRALCGLPADFLVSAAECPGEEAAKQMQMQVQQYVMIGGIFLNQTAPELMQEWMNAVKVRSEGPKVRLTADFSKRFLEQLAATSEKMTEKADPPTASPAASDGKKKR